MANNNNQRRLHAIFIPYPLQGHVIPSVHLATKLASKGFTISFINTHFIHHQISKAHHQSDDHITGTNNDIFAEARKSGLDIHYYTVSDGLPLDFDRSINHDQFMASLLHVFSAHIEELIRTIIIKSTSSSSSSNNIPPVNCLIADTFFVWPSMISKKLGLLYASFWTEPALVYSLYYHMNLLRKNGHFGSNDNREDIITYIPGVPAIEPTDLMSYLQDTDLSTVCHQIIFKAFDDVKGADFVICNTVQELEPETISALQVDKPFYAIGPIFPTGFTKSNVATSLWAESDCTQWLDSKPNGSVLYVSFGSYAHISKKDLTEIAHGLLLSKVNFVFVLRPDVVSSDEPDPLPNGFLEESKDRGIIVQWCCQIAVLSHPAVGGFLTHCGWNSILESIWCGVPILCFPLLTDQFTNRKLVVDDWRIGLHINGRKQITRKEVSDKITRMMDDKLGQEFRKEIKEVKKALQNASKDDGSSEKNFNQFVKDLTVLIGEKSGTPLV